MGELKKIYFPNLNGLRFIAALFVIIHHIEQFKSLFGLKNSWSSSFIVVLGKLGVILFFVLSGFLITYLLLLEEKNNKTISIKNFYVRRLLRIWPLYYLLAFLSLFLFPYIPFLEITSIISNSFFENIQIKIILFILFLPNIVFILYSPVPYLSQSWSVGVEEQFYLIWPILMKKIKNKLKLLYSVIIIYLLIKIGLFIIIKIFGDYSILITSYSFISAFSIDCMAIGGVLAYYLFIDHKFLKIIFSKYVQYATYSILVFLIGLGVRIPYFHYEFYAILFGIVIINLAANKNSILNLENTIFNYLGKISYGLYMYHPLCIVLTLKLFLILGIKSILLQYIIITIFTICVSGISYKYYESYFIKKKVKFSNIISGDNAK